MGSVWGEWEGWGERWGGGGGRGGGVRRGRLCGDRFGGGENWRKTCLSYSPSSSLEPPQPKSSTNPRRPYLIRISTPKLNSRRQRPLHHRTGQITQPVLTHLHHTKNPSYTPNKVRPGRLRSKLRPPAARTTHLTCPSNTLSADQASLPRLARVRPPPSPFYYLVLSSTTQAKCMLIV